MDLLPGPLWHLFVFWRVYDLRYCTEEPKLECLRILLTLNLLEAQEYLIKVTHTLSFEVVAITLGVLIVILWEVFRVLQNSNVGPEVLEIWVLTHVFKISF